MWNLLVYVFPKNSLNFLTAVIFSPHYLYIYQTIQMKEIFHSMGAPYHWPNDHFLKC